MKKQFLYNWITYLLAMIGGCLVNLAVCAMAVKIVNLFIVVDYFTAAIIRAAVSAVVVSGVLGAISCFESYKSAEFNLGRSCAVVAAAGGAHLILSVVLMFYPFIAGGTRYLAGLIDMGTEFDSADKVSEIYLWTYLIAFAVYLALQIITVIACGIIAKNKRLALRASHTEQKEGK